MTGFNVTIGSFNIHCLTNNKVPTLRNFIINHNLHLLALTETWHAPESSVVKKLREAGYCIVDECRPRSRKKKKVVRGGGNVGLL